MRVAVVGCGAVGARAARQLVSSAEIDQVVLRDTRSAWLQSLADSLGPAAIVHPPPYDDVPDVDGIVLATPSGLQPQLAHAALSRDIPVVATADSVDDVRLLLSLDGEARRRNVPVVVGAGFAPGLTCVLARFGARNFDVVDEVHVAKAGTGGPACARNHHRALSGTAFDWRDGAWARRRGGSGRELVWFPEPVGGRDCYRGALADPLLLLPEFPDATRITSRMAATRRDRLTMRLPMMLPPHAEGGPGAARVELRGSRGGVREVAVYGVLDRPAVAAGAVAALALLRALTGRLTTVGAAGLARLVEPVPFLIDLAARGVRVAVFDGTPRVPPFPEPH
ncbi:MAG TPA: Gfo/Idh/MocA family oxidoreductase [Acidimicrobiales bacterium]